MMNCNIRIGRVVSRARLCLFGGLVVLAMGSVEAKSSRAESFSDWVMEVFHKHPASEILKRGERRHVGAWEKRKLAKFETGYKKRIKSDSNDYDALILCAATKVLQLGEEPKIVDLFESFGYKPLFFNKEALHHLGGKLKVGKNSLKPNAVVAVLVKEVKDVLESALADLEAIPDTWNGSVQLSLSRGSVDEDPYRLEDPDEPTYADLADVMVARAVGKGALAVLELLQGYDCTFDYEKLYEAYESALEDPKSSKFKHGYFLNRDYTPIHRLLYDAFVKDNPKYMTVVRNAASVRKGTELLREALETWQRADRLLRDRTTGDLYFFEYDLTGDDYEWNQALKEGGGIQKGVAAILKDLESVDMVTKAMVVKWIRELSPPLCSSDGGACGSNFDFDIGEVDVSYASGTSGTEEYATVVLELSADSVYSGGLYDAATNLVGTLQVKAAKTKLNRKTGRTTSRATVTVQIAGEKKTTAIGTLDANEGTLALTAKDGRALALTLDATDMSGTLGGYTVAGTRNLLLSKDKAELASATAVADAVKARGSLVVSWPEGGTNGVNALTVSFAAKGTAKIKGTLANGTKIGTTAQMIVGEGVYSLPVVYTKKNKNKTEKLAFALDFSRDGAFCGVTGLEGATVTVK